MRTQAMPASRTTFGTQLQLDDILGGMPVETLAERDRPEPARPIADRPCDGCGDPGPTVDLWAEHSETGEQVWHCTACGD
jgi:hypothetical protein